MRLTPEAESDIQGMVLSGYGHLDHAGFIFLHVRDAAAGRRWLGEILPLVTTGERWEVLPDGSRAKPVRTLNVAFSYPGVLALGQPPEVADTFDREFVFGMPQRAGVLGDVGESAPDRWELGGPHHPAVHLMMMAYAISPEELEAWVAELRDALRRHRGVSEVAYEEGHRFGSKEQFGFHDGVSQPFILGTAGNPEADAEVISTGEFILGYPNEFGFLPPTPGVPKRLDEQDQLPDFPDLEDWKDLGRHGSYLVYRKLSQDVAGYWRWIENEACRPLGCADDEETRLAMKKLASKCFGRWPTGAPLVLSPDHDDASLGDSNDFTYAATDPDGLACPAGSHVRRSNPRDALAGDDPEQSVSTVNRHRVLRRAITYGKPLFERSKLDGPWAPMDLEDDGEPRGIHFFAINASIATQFEFVQQGWSNAITFSGLSNDKDPISGDNDATHLMTVPEVPLRRRLEGVPRFVQVRGGVYLFLPSVMALRYLASPGAQPTP
jgi:deferrochelatase/peroxidase EfeB